MSQKRDENAKDPRWQVPTGVPSVGPGVYDATMDQSGGSQGETGPEQPGRADRGQR